MIKLGNKDITPKNFVKVTKGEKVVWEANTFKELDIFGFGATTINDGGEYELPLNIPLKITTQQQFFRAEVTKNAKKYILEKNETFMIKSAGTITISKDGVWDITVKKSSNPVRRYIE